MILILHFPLPSIFKPHVKTHNKTKCTYEEKTTTALKQLLKECIHFELKWEYYFVVDNYSSAFYKMIIQYGLMEFEKLISACGNIIESPK